MRIFKKLQDHIDAALADPQRIAGGTLPNDAETAEAVRTRGARHIEMDGDER